MYERGVDGGLWPQTCLHYMGRVTTNPTKMVANMFMFYIVFFQFAQFYNFIRVWLLIRGGGKNDSPLAVLNDRSINVVLFHLSQQYFH